MPCIDSHQHLLPEAFLTALRARSAPPLVDGGVLRLAHQSDAPLALAGYTVPERVAALDAAEIDVGVVSLSAALGVEALPADQGAPLLAAYHEGAADAVAASGGRLRAWAATPLDLPDAGASVVEPLLDEGFVGVSIPSEALATPAGIDHARLLLELLERRGRPLFVHPGPAPGTAPYARTADVPGWWANLAVYPGLSLRALFTWRAHGAAAHPRLRLLFAIMAGGAPFLEERYRTFADGDGAIDRNVFFDAASCGRLALEHAFATYGLEQIVFGTDIPVIPPGPLVAALTDLGDPVCQAVMERNPTQLFNGRGGVT
jgi:predicted TIM-barrel fold metal-dependent hydrolase